MEAVYLPQKNSTLPAQPMDAPEGYCPVNKVAIHAIRALGAILVAAGIGCIIAGLQVPAIALLVASAAALVLGFALDKSRVQPEALSAMAFGRKEWIQYMGLDPGEVPPLPLDIEEILAKPSPFWKDKTVADTDMLVLIPKTVTKLNTGVPFELPLTLRTLKLLATSPTDNPGIKFPGIEDQMVLENYEDNPIQKSHWVLMTKDVIPVSKYHNYDLQKYWVENHWVEETLTPTGYEVPSCLEAAAAILLENMRSKEYLFCTDPKTYTRCREIRQTFVGERIVSVGGFDPHNGLRIVEDKDSEHRLHGMAAIRKLSPAIALGQGERL